MIALTMSILYWPLGRVTSNFCPSAKVYGCGIGKADRLPERRRLRRLLYPLVFGQDAVPGTRRIDLHHSSSAAASYSLAASALPGWIVANAFPPMCPVETPTHAVLQIFGIRMVGG